MTPAPWSISNGTIETIYPSGAAAMAEVTTGYLVSHDDGHVALVFSLEDARAIAGLPALISAARQAKGGLLALADLLERHRWALTAKSARSLIADLESALSEIGGAG